MKAESANFLAVLRTDNSFIPQLAAVETYFKSIEEMVSIAMQKPDSSLQGPICWSHVLLCMPLLMDPFWSQLLVDCHKHFWHVVVVVEVSNTVAVVEVLVAVAVDLLVLVGTGASRSMHGSKVMAESAISPPSRTWQPGPSYLKLVPWNGLS